MTSKKSNKDTPGADRGVIGLGDLMRALKGLNAPDPKTIERIARSLGFTGIDANPVEEVKGVSGARQRPRMTEKTRSRDMPQHDRLPPLSPQPDLPAEVLDMHMAPVEMPPPSAALPEWLDDGPMPDASAPPPIARASLFPARSAKGVLTAAVATRRPGLTPDVQQLIRSFTRGRILTEFPYRPRPSLHRGVQLLMDTSEAMTPFLDDLDDLARALMSLAGRHACDLYEFAGNPNDATRWSMDFREIGWRPVSARPIVVATDFGIGAEAAAHDRAGLRDWHRFAGRAHEAGVPVIAFVPYGRDRWPKALTRAIRFIHWDPRTHASHIKKLFGIGHEVAE
jgi:hypothetical protein